MFSASWTALCGALKGVRRLARGSFDDLMGLGFGLIVCISDVEDEY